MGPRTRVYSDRAGRELRTITESFDGPNQPANTRGQQIAKDTVYSAVGTKTLETQPYFRTLNSSTTAGSSDHGVTLNEYDALGRVVATFAADPTGLVAAKSFGTYGTRQAARTQFAFSGNTVTITNDKGQARVEEKNAAGQVVRVTDPAGGQIVHQHDAFGNLVATKDALQNSITIQFDIRGRRLQLNDPDAGLQKFEYNALGEVVWSETPNQRAAGTSTTTAYDKLGRMVSRVEPEGTGTWSYDKYIDNSACATGIGRLCESRYVRAGTSDTRNTRYFYDSLGRIQSDVATVTNGPTMATAKTYDATTGRLATKTFPTGVQVGYSYTALGYPEQLRLLTTANLAPLPSTPGGAPGAATVLATNTVLWRAVTVNAWGKVEQQTTSNGVNSRFTVQAATGRTVGLTAGPGTSNTVINHSYAWDSLNNLTYRADNIGDAVAGAVTETFVYGDNLSRLTAYTVAAPGVPGGSRTVTMQYNALGMLLNKSDVGVYTYGASGPGAVRPHALLSMTSTSGATTSYSYDGNGNLVTASAGKYRSIAYTSFNLPDSQSGIGGETVSGTSSRYTWVYDENRQRIKEVRTISGGGAQAGTRTTWYLHPDNAGGLGFEQEVNTPTTASAANPAVTSNRHYLSFGGSTIGVLVSTGALTTAPTATAPPVISSSAEVKVEYWHKDHLGSLIATTDHAGVVTARYAYDPFGKRRFTNGSYDAFGTVVVDWSAAVRSGTDRGYTGHEHLDDVGIIHMNGRLFDPLLGRFLQVDPFVQDPKNLQNYNRYAYCFNNPLTCTDPTGHDFDIDSFGGGDFGWQNMYSAWMSGRIDIPGLARPQNQNSIALNTAPDGYYNGHSSYIMAGGDPTTLYGPSSSQVIQITGRAPDRAIGWATEFAIAATPFFGGAYGSINELVQGNYGWAAFNVATVFLDFASFGTTGSAARGIAATMRAALQPLGRAVSARLSEHAVEALRSNSLQSLTRGVENVLTGASSVNEARNTARFLSGVGDNAIPFVATNQHMAGTTLGMQSTDGLRGWRFDFDNTKGFHINFWDQTAGPSSGIKGAILLPGGEDAFRSIVQHFPGP